MTQASKKHKIMLWIFGFLTVTALAFVFAQVTALAGVTVTYGGETVTFADDKIEEAWSKAAENNGTLKLSGGSFEVSGVLTLNAGQSVTLNCNGRPLSKTYNGGHLAPGGELFNIAGSLTILNANISGGYGNLGSTIYIHGNGSVTIDCGIVKGNPQAVGADGGVCYLADSASLVLKSDKGNESYYVGTVQNDFDAGYYGGNIIYNAGTGNVDVYKGRIYSKSTIESEKFWSMVYPCAVLNASSGNINIYGPMASGQMNVRIDAPYEDSGSAIRNEGAGNVLISGSAFVEAYVGTALLGPSTECAVIENHSTGTITADRCVIYSKNITIISNRSNGNVIIKEGFLQVRDNFRHVSYPLIRNYGNGGVNISGGTISAGVQHAIKNEGKGKIVISGGIIESSRGEAYTEENQCYSRVTIELCGGTPGEIVLEISGGSICNLAGDSTKLKGTDDAAVIANSGNGDILISGGTVYIPNLLSDGEEIVYGEDPFVYRHRSTAILMKAGTSGNVTITGGNVYADLGCAIIHESDGLLTISGGLVKSLCDSTGTVYVKACDAKTTRVLMTGGEIQSNFTNSALYSGTYDKVDNKCIYSEAKNEGAIKITGGRIMIYDINQEYHGEEWRAGKVWLSSALDLSPAYSGDSFNVYYNGLKSGSKLLMNSSAAGKCSFESCISSEDYGKYVKTISGASFYINGAIAAPKVEYVRPTGYLKTYDGTELELGVKIGDCAYPEGLIYKWSYWPDGDTNEVVCGNKAFYTVKNVSESGYYGFTVQLKISDAYFSPVAYPALSTGEVKLIISVIIKPKPLTLTWSGDEGSLVMGDTLYCYYSGETIKPNASAGDEVIGDDNLGLTVTGQGLHPTSETLTATASITNKNYKLENPEIKIYIFPGTNKLTEEIVLTSWTYGEAANTPTAKTKFGTPRFEYSDDGGLSFSGTVPVNAGTYQVRAKVSGTSDYYSFTSDTVSFTIYKIKVDVPEGNAAGSKAYTGSALKSDIMGTALYSVYENAGGVNAGKYDVIIRLSDFRNYGWSTGEDTISRTLKFEITQAVNTFITAVTIEGWTSGDEKKSPSSQARFGTPVYTYSSEYGGVYTGDVPTKAGSYYVKASVAATDNYSYAESITMFIIDRKIYASIKALFKDGAPYTVDEENGYIKGFTDKNNTVGEFLSNLTETEYIRITDSAEKDITQSSARLLGTGFTIKLIDDKSETVDELTVVVRGDVNGDGKINIVDCMKLRAQQLGKVNDLNGVYLEAGIDVFPSSSALGIVHYMKLRAYQLGKITSFD